MTKLEYAQLFQSLGIAVIPLRHRGKEPASHLMGGSWERYKSLQPTEYDVKNWLWSGWQNYGVVTGHNHLAVLDFDDMTAYQMWNDFFTNTLKCHDVLQLTGDPFMVKSARGVHVYITLLEADLANQKRLGVDVKIHGYVVGPGCTHPSGTEYQALNHSFYFPDVFSLETILPVDLFPVVAGVEIENPVIAMAFEPPARNTEYDPYQVASLGNTEDLITRVKRAVRIESWFSDRRQTSGDGRWWAAKCPFHDDQNPSFWIDAQRQICGCESCRMKPMDAINLFSRMNKISDAIAVSQLAKMAGVI